MALRSDILEVIYSGLVSMTPSIFILEEELLIRQPIVLKGERKKFSKT